jgi:RHS repeat-associated protein
MRYKPYGEIRYTEGISPTNRQFTGQYADGNLNLVQMGDRWYDSALGRWLSPDTIVPQPGNPQNFNRYSYTRNNPLKYIDPSGHFTQCVATDGGYQCWDDGYSIDNPWDTSSDADTRRAWLLNYANNLATWARNGWLTDLDALGQLSDFAVSLIPSGASNRTLAYVNDMSSVLIGAEGVNVLLKSLIADYDAPNFGDTGFHRDYQDRQNQLYHFWAYVTTVANGNNLGGWFMGIAGNGGHEMFDPGEAFRKLKTGNSGMSWEDYCLALTGMSLGQKLATGAVSIEQADDWMRGALSTEYPGKIDDSWRATGIEWWPSKIWERAVTTVAQAIYIDWYYYMPK